MLALQFLTCLQFQDNTSIDENIRNEITDNLPSKPHLQWITSRTRQPCILQSDQHGLLINALQESKPKLIIYIIKTPIIFSVSSRCLYSAILLVSMLITIISQTSASICVNLRQYPDNSLQLTSSPYPQTHRTDTQYPPALAQPPGGTDSSGSAASCGGCPRSCHRSGS